MKKFAVSYTRLGGRLERTEVFGGQSAADVVDQVMTKYPRCRIHKVSSKEELEALEWQQRQGNGCDRPVIIVTAILR